jgi:transposase-like protein
VRTSNRLERIPREIRRRTTWVGAFPDGQSVLNLAAARLRHIAGTAWSTKRYLNIELLIRRASPFVGFLLSSPATHQNFSMIRNSALNL